RPHDGMSRRVLDQEAQFTTALVQIKCARLKNGFFLSTIEIAEGDEIIEQFKQVAVIADKPLDGDDIQGFGFKRLVSGDQGGDRFLVRTSQYVAHSFQT